MERTYKKSIDLANFQTPNSIVLSGREKGELVRKKLNLDEEDKTPESIDIKVPNEIVSLNSSFFLGLFAPSVIKLGISGFDHKYHFTCNETQKLDVERGKKEALNRSNPLQANDKAN